MATLIMQDGSKKVVTYNQAAQIQCIKEGTEDQEKTTDTQYAFARTVKAVIFDKTVTAPPILVRRGAHGPDEVMQELITTPHLHGIGRARRIIERIRERTTAAR